MPKLTFSEKLRSAIFGLLQDICPEATEEDADIIAEKIETLILEEE